MKLRHYLIVGVMLISSSPCSAWAAQTPSDNAEDLGEMVILATRTATAEREIASSITVITAKDMENQKTREVADILRQVPGLFISSSGTPGASTSVFMRGAKSEQTLVLIDGVKANNPIIMGGGYDLSTLMVDNIERIEVIRGPQSTLYGTDAMGGVINIITKKGKDSFTGFASIEGGSFYNFREAVGFRGAYNKLDYSLTASNINSEGLSSYDEKMAGSEKDGFRDTTVSANVGYKATDNLDFRVIARYIDSDKDLDSYLSDDPNYTAREKQFYLRGEGSLRIGDWKQTLGIDYMHFDRKDENLTDTAHQSDWSNDDYTASRFKLDWLHAIDVLNFTTFTFGFEGEQESGQYDYSSNWGVDPTIKEHVTTYSMFAQDQLRLWNSLFVTLGCRLDRHSQFDEAFTWRAAAAYILPKLETKFKATYGTGFKSPTLYQLYSSYGDQNLQPEESKGWDFGFEQPFWNKRINVGATFFKNEFTNMIDYDYSLSHYNNIASASTYGVESFISGNVYKGLDFKATYTYLQTEDDSTNGRLPRRPNHTYSVNGNYRFFDNRANVNATLVYVGSRIDSGGQKLYDYYTVDMAVSFDINKYVQVFGRINNLFDADYRVVYGYTTPGIHGFGGVKLSF